MCTVSVVGWHGGLRVVANRDEQRARPAAIAPTLIARHGVRAMMPIDPASGGTWISVNDYGLTIALLNVNRPTLRCDGIRSRGDIVARLAGLRSVDAVVDALSEVDARAYSPFRVVCAAGSTVVELAPHVGGPRFHRLDSPLMFTSSGLGDDRVEGVRRELFERMLPHDDRDDATDVIGRQDAFHAHQWAAWPHLSVFMDRDDACTVSRTVVEVNEREVWMTYAARPDWTTDRRQVPRRSSVY